MDRPEKLSAHRFRKHRKRSGTSRPIPDGSGFGAGPVRPQTLYAVPFESDGSNRSSVKNGIFGVHSSKNSIFESGDGLLKEKSGLFVFGSFVEAEKVDFDGNSTMCCNGSSFLPEELMRLKIDSCEKGAKSSSFVSGDGLFNGQCEGIRKKEKENAGLFEFGGFAETKKVDFDQSVFIFGGDDGKNAKSGDSSSPGFDESLISSLPDQIKSMKLHGSGNEDSVFCVHGNGGKKSSTHSTKNSIFVSGDGLFDQQCDRTRKKDQENSGDVECQKADAGLFEFGRFVETKKVDFDQNSTVCSNGSSFSKLPDDLMKLKIDTCEKGEKNNKEPGVFVFGSGVSNSNCASKSSSFEFSDNSLSKLPQKMENLNLHSSVGDVCGETEMDAKSNLKKHGQFSQTSSLVHDAGGFPMFTGELKNQTLHSSGNEEHGNDNHGVFIFGRDDRKNANSGDSSSLGFDASSISNLPDQRKNMKLHGTSNHGVFIFGRDDRKNANSGDSASPSFDESSISNLPDQIKDMKLHGTSNHGVFIFGRDDRKNANSGDSASTSFDESSISNLPDQIKNMKLHGTSNHGVFIFGRDDRKNANSGDSSYPSFDESSISNLPDQIKNMKLHSTGNEDDSQKVKPGNAWNQHDNIAASNLTSHSSREDNGSRVAPLQAHNSCGLNAEPTSISSVLPGFQNSVNHLYFTSNHTGSETPMEFKSKKPDASLLTKENVFTIPHKNTTFSMKKEDSKAVRLRSKRGKSRNSTPMHTGVAKQFLSVDKGPEENQGQDSTGGDSPMDYSPYQETLVSSQCSREAPVATFESIHFDSRYASNDAQKSSFADRKEEELFSAVEHFDTNEILHENKEADCSRVPSASHFTSVDEMTSNENFESVIQEKSFSMEAESFNYVSSIKQPTYEGEFAFNSCSDDAVQSNFLFTAASAQGPSSSSKRNYRRIIKIKGRHESLRSSSLSLASPPSMSLFPNAHVPTDPKQELKGSADSVRAGKVNATKPNQESAEEACEKWRLRGNQAYADRNLSKAEDYYSHGVDSFSFKEASKSCSRALMLCYSNRAATRMSLGRLREALNDCMVAVAIDPNFLRARVRAGNIHLSLGEPTDALQHFEKVLQLDKETKSDQKILLEAVDGIEKIQKLNDLTDQSSLFLTKRIPDDATKALDIISEALSIAPNSEILLEMKAEALVKLRNFEEAIQLSEQTLEFAEKNFSCSETDCMSKDSVCSKSVKMPNSRFWRWRIISKSYFYLGKIEEANELLQKHEKVKPVIDKYPESSASFPVTVRELLRLKTAGNEAFQAGKHLEAVELYTAALALNTESRPFTAICFCNRAAAYQALGQITDAIADCSLAIALDSNYKRAISRRATLHEMIRDYGQAVTDLQKITSLLEMHSEAKNSTGAQLGRSSSNTTDLNQARMRLSTVEEEARKGGTLDMYMILGLEKACSATDVRKAYRKAALRHHPDKAGQFLARSENGDDRVWREIAEEVHSDADRLFKMIGEAYAILLDPSKRGQYDTEEELRTMKKSYGRSSPPRTSASSYSSQHERSSNPRHWRSYGSSYQR